MPALRLLNKCLFRLKSVHSGRRALMYPCSVHACAGCIGTCTTAWQLRSAVLATKTSHSSGRQATSTARSLTHRYEQNRAHSLRDAQLRHGPLAPPEGCWMLNTASSGITHTALQARAGIGGCLKQESAHPSPCDIVHSSDFRLAC